MRHCFGIVREVLHRICHIDVHLGKLAAWSRRSAPAPEGLNGLRPAASSEDPPVWKSDLPEQDRGIKIVGTPLGTAEFVSAVGRQVVEEEAQLLQALPKLPNLQAAWLLLYFCAVPRINHLLRTVAPALVEPTATAHDNRIFELFRHLFGICGGSSWALELHGTSFENCRRQALLPLRLGGCGLRDSSRTSHAAFWASWADCLPVLRLRCLDVHPASVQVWPPASAFARQGTESP